MNSFMVLSSSALGLPVVQAKSATTSNDDSTNSSHKIKVSSLPLYPEPEKHITYQAKPPCMVESAVRDLRVQVAEVKKEYQPIIDQVSHVIDTGRAHTNESIAYLREDSNLVARVGAIATGGLLGLIAARKGRFFKKISYFSLGAGGIGSVCYPSEAKILAIEAKDQAVKNARVGYHFIVGTRPSVQNENGKAFERMTSMVSDIGQWGFRLFESKPAAEEEKKQDSAPEKVEIKEEKEQPIAVVEDKIENEIVAAPNDIAETTSQLTPEVATKFDEVTEEPLPAESNISVPKEEEKKDESKAPFEGDLGQGNLDDKELYTTRM